MSPLYFEMMLYTGTENVSAYKYIRISISQENAKN